MKLFGFTIIRTEDRDAELASRDGEIKDLRSWLTECGHKRVAAENEVIRLREALWSAQAGGYLKADGTAVEIKEHFVRRYSETRTWAPDELLELDATVSLIGIEYEEVYLLTQARFVEFRGLKWRLNDISRPREAMHPEYTITMSATADPTESVPDFKRGYTGR